MKYNINKLIKKYNKVLSEKYRIKDYDLLEEDFTNVIDSLESLMYDCCSDGEQQYLECKYLRMYFYYKEIKEYIKYFEEYDLKIKEEK